MCSRRDRRNPLFGNIDRQRNERRCHKLDEEGYPKLIDFGTAKLLRGRTYTVVGTPHYMAPEVITGRGYGVSADYWSVGVMLFEFLCGFVPFGEDEERPTMVYEKVIQSQYTYPSYVSKELKAKGLIEQLLDKRPAARAHGLHHHPWLSQVSWDALLCKKGKAPYLPPRSKLDANALAGKKSSDLEGVIAKEEKKEGLPLVAAKVRAPPSGWDEEF